ncbi:MAG: hypothetical protein ABIH72_02915 [archaeon]
MKINIDYEVLKATIDKAKVKFGHQFEYKDKTFNVFTCRHTKENEENGELPVFWTSNSSTAYYDIYIATNAVKKEFRKPVLLHETLEAFLFEDFFEEFDIRTAKGIAHEIAKGYDKKYAREALSDELFEEYLQLREKLNTSFFGR